MKPGLQPGTNAASYAALRALEVAEPLELSREVTRELARFAVDTAAIGRYLDALGKALQATHSLVVRAVLVAETPAAVHLRTPHLPLDAAVAWHPIFNAPYIPSTTIKGAMRATGLSACGRTPDQLFGRPGDEGDLVVTDALPTTPNPIAADVITPHYREPDRIQEHRVKPNPIVYPVIRPGATFELYLAADLDARCAAPIYAILEQAAQRGIGAKTRLGYGIFRRR